MKSSPVCFPSLLVAGAALALAALPLRAAPETAPAPPAERHIEVRTTAPGPGAPAHEAAPVTFLGVEVAPVDEALGAQLKLPPDHGLVVRFVAPDSPAAAAGVRKNDVLTRLDDQLLIAPRQLSALVRSHKEGDTIALTYLRAGAETRVSATLAKRVPPVAAAGTLRWFGAGDGEMTFPETHKFVFHTGDDVRSLAAGSDRLRVAPAAPVPHVRIYRPSARVIYSEGDVTLEVTSNEEGRFLEARGADGKTLFSGPIDTPEQRAAVPAELQKHLKRLDALEPARLDVPVPTPPAAPVAPSAPGSAPDMSWDEAGESESAAGLTTVRVEHGAESSVPGASTLL